LESRHHGRRSELLIGFGWFVNFRVYERDKRLLQDEISSQVKEEFSHFAAETRQDLVNQLDSGLNSLRSTIEHEAASLRAKVYELEYHRLCSEAKDWLESGVVNNMFRTGCKLLEIAILEDNAFHVGRALDVILRSLKNHATPHVTGISELSKLLESLSSEHKLDVDIIRDMLRQVRSGLAINH